MSRRRLGSRPDRRVPALAAAAALTAIGTFGAWWAVTMLLDRQPTQSIQTLQELTWDDTPLVGAAILAALVGITFILVSIVPGRSRVAEANPLSATSERTTAVTARGLVRMAAGEAERTHGVLSFHARGGGSRLRVRIVAAAREQTQVQTAVDDRIRARIQSLGLHTAPRVRVSAHAKKTS